MYLWIIRGLGRTFVEVEVKVTWNFTSLWDWGL
jgi:hypothetical protein